MKRGIGVALFSFGTFLLISSQTSTITGNVVADRVTSISSILGLIGVVGGLVLMASKSQLERELTHESEGGTNLIFTNKFLKQARNYDLNSINKALLKINTKLGKEHSLKGDLKGYEAIREGKGPRIRFKYLNSSKSEAEVDTLDPSHDY